MSALATSWDESPVFYTAAGNDIFGLITRPTVAPNEIGVLIIWGTGSEPTPGRNQIRTRLARRLAASGFVSLRLDYHGVGESSGPFPRFRFEDPVVDDVVAGAACLREHGARRIAIVAHCFGGRNALAASDQIDDLVGLVMLSPPVQDEEHLEAKVRREPLRSHLLRLLRPREWVRAARDPRRRRVIARAARFKLKDLRRRGAQRPSADAHAGASAEPHGGHADGAVSPYVFRPLARLLRRGTRILLVYGDKDDFYPGFQEASAAGLGRLLTDRADLASIEIRAGRLHGYAALAVQDYVLDSVDQWLAALAEQLTQPA